MSNPMNQLKSFLLNEMKAAYKMAYYESAANKTIALFEKGDQLALLKAKVDEAIKNKPFKA